MRIGLLSIVLLALPAASLAQDRDADVRTWMRLGRVDRGTATREVRETRDVLLLASRSRAPSSEPLGALRMVMFRRLEATHGVHEWNEQRRWFEDRLRVRLDAEALTTMLGVHGQTSGADELEWCVGTSIDLGLGWTVEHCERALAYAVGVPVIARERDASDLGSELLRRGVPAESVRRIEPSLRASMRAMPHQRIRDASAQAVSVALLRSCPPDASAVERVRAWETASPTVLVCAATLMARAPRDGAVLATSDVFGLDISDAETVLDVFAVRTSAHQSTQTENRATSETARNRVALARTVQRSRARLHRCADAAPYAGEVLFDATIAIDGSGRVERVTLVPSAGEPNESMTSCVSRVLETLRFSEGPAESVTLPLMVPRSE